MNSITADNNKTIAKRGTFVFLEKCKEYFFVKIGNLIIDRKVKFFMLINQQKRS